MEIKDLAGLSQPLTKLIEVCSAGIGKIYEPTHIRRTAKAKADEIKILAEAIENHSYLPVKYENGNVIIDNSKQSNLVMRAQERLLFQETQKQQNIESVIANAYHELENEKAVSDRPVDNDWISRFFNSVEDISNEDMQKIWGKILAGEIKQPETYSLQTLSLLKNLSVANAMLFQKVAQHSLFLGDVYALMAEEEYERGKYTFSDLMKLEDCGLLYTTELNNTRTVGANKIKIARNEEIVVLASTIEPSFSLNIPIRRFSNFGTQLRDIANINIKNENILHFAHIIKKSNAWAIVSAHRIIDVLNDNHIRYEKRIDLLQS